MNNKNNINLLDEIMKCSADIDMLKCITSDLDTTINARSVNLLDDTAYFSPIQLELNELHYNMTKIFDELININTQLDDLYSDIQHIKDILNI